MTTLIAIGYGDETSAAAAGEEALRLAPDLGVEPDAIAVIRRDVHGWLDVTTHHDVGGAGWGMCWRVLFGVFFFVPVLGTTLGADLRGLLDSAANRVDPAFGSGVRDLVRPGTSALFLAVQEGRRRALLESLGRYEGTVLETSISEPREARASDVPAPR
jgi:uncharacterized membrane protein